MERLISDALGVIHMNGRVYDPELGRFLSPDPVTQFPASTQGLDRYSYVQNNPLRATDPSGNIVQFLPVLAAIGSTYVKSLTLKLLMVAAAGYLATGTLQGAFFSVASMGMAAGVGEMMATFNIANQAVAATVAGLLHGVTQGALGVMQGQRFGAAFASAFASKAFGPGPVGGSLSGSDRILRVLQASAVGGTASRLSGGKFANGAVTGAFVEAFNNQGGTRGGSGDEARDLSISDDQRQLLADGNYRGFWESRLEQGDPVARSALDVIDNRGIGGRFANWRLHRMAMAHSVDLSGARIDELRLSIAQTHAEWTMRSVDSGHSGYLTPRAIASYHHHVFGGVGLPKTAFAGTPFFGGALWQADLVGKHPVYGYQGHHLGNAGWCARCR